MILVTGGSRRACLTVVRSLGSKGLKICVGDYVPLSTAFLSRYATEKFIYPDPQKNPKGYFDAILSRVKTGKINVVMPLHDFEIFPILMHKKEIEKHCILPFVEFETFMKTVNKYETINIAKSAGVPVPETHLPKTLDDVRKIAKEINYPVVVKPISQTDWSFEKGAITRYVTEKNYITGKKDLLAFFENIKDVEKYLIQEYISGRGAGVAYLFNRGRLRASFAYMRLREYPITGGPSTLRISIEHNQMMEAGKRLLEKLGWHGVAMVEFKLTSNDNPVLMEINGRFWGSLALAYYSGVDFPYLLYRMAVDGDVTPVTKYKTGVLCRWLIPGDILNFYFRLKSENLNNIHVFKEFFTFHNMHYDYLDVHDPLPVIGAIITSVRYFWNYLKGKRTISGEYR